MLQNYYKYFILSIAIFLCSITVNAQLKRKPPGEIDRQVPDTKEEIHREIHDIKARERQMKATRVYTDMNRITAEKRKLKFYKRHGNREDYNNAKNALNRYKLHLRAERRRNRQMEVFD